MKSVKIEDSTHARLKRLAVRNKLSIRKQTDKLLNEMLDVLEKKI